MALIPHNIFPRSMFDMDQWFHPHQPHHQPSTLDLFDPFDELDHMIGRNLEWLNKPEFMRMPLMPRVPQKYRIVVDCHGYQPKSIKTEVNGDRLTVIGNEEVRHEGGEDFSVKQFKRTYRIPSHAETDKMVSFMTRHGQLVIEMPLHETQQHSHTDLFPKIVDVDGGKQVQMRFNVPENIDPSKVCVSIKDRDLIVKAEDKIEKPDGISRFYYYKRTTLPENTKFGELKCAYDNHQLSIQAPLDMEFKTYRSIPIEAPKQQALPPQQQQQSARQ